MAEKIITGIDIGTTYTKVLVARVETTPNKATARPHIIGTGISENTGVTHGYITDIDAVTASVQQAVAQAEKTAKVTVRTAHVAIGSISTQEHYTHGEIVPTRADSTITQTDLDKVLQDSEDRIIESLPNDTVLHNIPLQYNLDGEKILGTPVGRTGTKLEVDGLLLSATEQHVTDHITAVENAGVRVEDVIVSTLAASFVTVNTNQKQAGCVLIDIGSDTTNIAVFEDGTPISVAVFQTGATTITNEIALQLRIPLEEAEKIKRGGMTSARFSKRQLDDIIVSQYDKLFLTVNKHLESLQRDKLLPAGAILVGGGATPLSVESAKRTLELPSRLATIDLTAKSKLRDLLWAVAYGLTTWGSAGTTDSSSIGAPKKSSGNFTAWIKQFLP